MLFLSVISLSVNEHLSCGAVLLGFRTSTQLKSHGSGGTETLEAMRKDYLDNKTQEKWWRLFWKTAVEAVALEKGGLPRGLPTDFMDNLTEDVKKNVLYV